VTQRRRQVLRFSVVTCALASACASPPVGSSTPDEQVATSTVIVRPPSANASAESAPVASASSAAGPTDRTRCAHVHIGLDLRALPQPVDPRDIEMYRGAQSSEFQELAPPGTSVDLYFSGGASFLADVHADSVKSAVAACERMVKEFLPKVPGHPLSRESGGSVLVPCRPCAPDDL
jgi:hypothetical protein